MIVLKWGMCPPEVRAALRPIIVQYLWLVPAWCRELAVYWSQRYEHDASMSTNGRAEYLFASIHVHPCWLEQSARNRRLDVIHEMLHIPALPMLKEHEDQIERLFSDGEAPKFRAKCDESWRKEMERMTQSLAYSVLQLDPATMPVVPFTEEEDEAGA